MSPYKSSHVQKDCHCNRSMVARTGSVSFVEFTHLFSWEMGANADLAVVRSGPSSIRKF